MDAWMNSLIMFIVRWSSQPLVACSQLRQLSQGLRTTHPWDTSQTQTLLNMLTTLASYLMNISQNFNQISALSISCYHHIGALRCIRPYLDLHTTKTTASSIVQSKLDYSKSLYYGLPKYQINRLQHIQNALARTVVQAPQFQHITPILKSLQWLIFWTNWI